MQKLLPIFFSLFFLLFIACDRHKNDADSESAIDVSGLAAVESENSVEGTMTQFQSAFEANENIGIVATVSHSGNAQNAGLNLYPTQIILFGNPKLGTPIMQENQAAGIDLPQKIMVYQKEAGEVVVTYNHPSYLGNRHGITENNEIINAMSEALTNFTKKAAGNADIKIDSTFSSDPVEGLITVASENSVDKTYRRLVKMINNNDAISIMAKLDHQANADRVGMDLRPTKLLVFGNPKLGTPLMKKSQTTGLDLPQKVLVYEDAEGQVFVAYNDPYYLADRHHLKGQETELDKISNVLKDLAEDAAK